MSKTESKYKQLLDSISSTLNSSFEKMKIKNPKKLAEMVKAKNYLDYEDNNGERRLWFYDDIMPPNSFGIGISNEDFRNALNGYTGPVKIYMNSAGGNALEARLMANFMRRRQEEDNQTFTVVVDGIVGSAATFIACAADLVQARPDVRYMIHRAQVEVSGNAEQVMTIVEEVMNPLDEEIARMYAEKTGLDISRIQELMSEETLMDGATASELGFIDELIQDVTEEEQGEPEESEEEQPQSEPSDEEGESTPPEEEPEITNQQDDEEYKEDEEPQNQVDEEDDKDDEDPEITNQVDPDEPAPEDEEDENPASPDNQVDDEDVERVIEELEEALSESEEQSDPDNQVDDEDVERVIEELEEALAEGQEEDDEEEAAPAPTSKARLSAKQKASFKQEIERVEASFKIHELSI